MNWDEADIVRRLCRSLDVTKKSIALFSERGYTDSQIVDNSFRPDKPIAEATMLLYAASGLAHAGVAERVEEVAAQLAPLARSQRIRLSMALHPALCVEFA